MKFRTNISGLCTWCRAAKETSVHIFWACPAIRSFWSLLRNKLALVFGQVKLSAYMVL
eukprot:c45049_g1_i1 orf=2-172(-)